MELYYNYNANTPFCYMHARLLNGRGIKTIKCVHKLYHEAVHL